MPAASRHAKPKKSALRFGAPVVAAATLAGVAAAFLFLHAGPAAPRPARHATDVTTTESALTDYRTITGVRRHAAALEAAMVRRRTRTAARRRRLAALATRRAQQAPVQPSPSPSPPPSPSPASTPPPSSGGGNAASSPLGVCIRNAEEGGSYAWGPGNGGGAYQFLLGTWENYGGAASEYGVAGSAYQDQIFDNAIAAGGASQWTDYDGC
jgi:hypothetical protein